MIAPIGSTSISPAIDAVRPGGSRGAASFQEALSKAVQTVENSSAQASTSVEQFLSGEGGELHTAILATQRAELAFDLFLQTRNKVVSAYQEIMRMPM